MNLRKKIYFLCLFFITFFLIRGIMAEDSRDLINLVLEEGTVVIETRPDLAPKHVKQIKLNFFEGEKIIFKKSSPLINDIQTPSTP